MRWSRLRWFKLSAISLGAMILAYALWWALLYLRWYAVAWVALIAVDVLLFGSIVLVAVGIVTAFRRGTTLQ